MISLIACVGKNLELGLWGDLVFHFKEDMRFFRRTTMGHAVLMGAKTFFSLPKDEDGVPKPLSGRTNYVLTHHPEELPDGVFGVTDLASFLSEHGPEEIFGIGGAQVYAELLPWANNLYLTEVDAAAEADVYFPDFERKNYDRIVLGQGEENGIKFTFIKYSRKN